MDLLNLLVELGGQLNGLSVCEVDRRDIHVKGGVGCAHRVSDGELVEIRRDHAMRLAQACLGFDQG